MKAKQSKLKYTLQGKRFLKESKLPPETHSMMYKVQGNDCSKMVSCSCILYFHPSSKSSAFSFLLILRKKKISRIRKQVPVNMIHKVCLSEGEFYVCQQHFTSSQGTAYCYIIIQQQIQTAYWTCISSFSLRKLSLLMSLNCKTWAHTIISRYAFSHHLNPCHHSTSSRDCQALSAHNWYLAINKNIL